MDIYESYMYTQPILSKIIKLTPDVANIIVRINGEDVEMLFNNSKQHVGENKVKYNFVSSSDGNKYNLYVSFKNNGRVAGIVSIEKDNEDIHNVNPAAFDSLRSNVEKNEY